MSPTSARVYCAASDGLNPGMGLVSRFTLQGLVPPDYGDTTPGDKPLTCHTSMTPCGRTYACAHPSRGSADLALRRAQTRTTFISAKQVQAVRTACIRDGLETAAAPLNPIIRGPPFTPAYSGLTIGGSQQRPVWT
jgi:hypothetical protein